MDAKSKAVRAYVAFMFAFLGRGLCAASEVDEVARAEIARFPEGWLFEMGVLPHGPSVRVRKRGGVFVLDASSDERPSLAIRFKHLRHALAALAFREGTPLLFADERLVVDGDVAWAMRMQRVLDRLLVLTLPEPIAANVLLRVPRVSHKARASARLLARMARNAVA